MKNIKASIFFLLVATNLNAQKVVTNKQASKKPANMVTPQNKAEMLKKAGLTTNPPKVDLQTKLTPQPVIQGMPKRGYAVDWLMPKSSNISKIPVFSKIELGIHITDSLSKLINAYVNELNEDKLNPFDPEQIDIYADFEYFESISWTKMGRTNSFYYQEYERDIASPDMNNWNWKKARTDDYFRIRYAASKIGKWRVTVMVNIKGKEVARMGEFEFTVTPSKNKGYVKVATDKTHFSLGKDSFIPIGQNLPKPTCYYEKDSVGKVKNDPLKCAGCPCAGMEDKCEHLKKLPLHPKAYMAYQDELSLLKKSGANFFRMIVFPFTYEVEYEKLGNYSSRMNCAWELDKVIEQAEKLDLKLDFNLFLGYPLSKAPNGVKAWDWNSDSNEDQGYCYRKELGLKEPIEFLTNPVAKKHFKNRIRYYIARYGYSTSIAIFELMSEINNKFPDNPLEVYKWQEEMMHYIKDILKHNNQLWATSYDGSGPNEAKGDLSYSIKNLDILGYNVHQTTNSRSELMNILEKNKKYGKPIMFSEIGTDDSGIETCDNHTEWLKDVWFTLFSGSASTGINWNLQHDYKTWENFKHLKNFLYGINLGAFQKVQTYTRKDKLIELMALSDTSANKCFGIIQNTSWNFYTQGSNQPCKNDKLPLPEQKSFKNAESLTKKKATVISLNPSKEYQIEWYNPLTGKNVDTLQFTSDSNGKIELMHPTLTQDMPMIAFKVYTKDAPFTRTPLKPMMNRQESPALPKLNKGLEIQDK